MYKEKSELFVPVSLNGYTVISHYFQKLLGINETIIKI